MKRCSEFDKAWDLLMELESVTAQRERNQAPGRYAEARRNSATSRAAAIMNAITPAATRKANRWQTPVIKAAWEAFRADEQIPFRKLLDHVMTTPGVPDEEAVRRFLNQMGFRGKPGRPKK